MICRQNVYLGETHKILAQKIETLILHYRRLPWDISGVTESHVLTRPNEISFMHNFHAILNDCKVMYLKYINSFARNLFVYCFYLQDFSKKLGRVLLSRAL